MSTSTAARTLTRSTLGTTPRTTLGHTLRRTAFPISLGLGTSGLIALHTHKPLRFDSVTTTTSTQTRTLSSGREPKRKDFLDPDTVKQLSGGSLAGMF